MIDVWLRDTLDDAWGRAIASTRLAIPTSSNAAGDAGATATASASPARISDRLA